MSTRRASGILLHPTAFAGDHGIGDLGDEAFEFVRFLSDAGQSYWQILPLGPTGYGDSPYNCFSAFAGNTLLISPEKLVQDGLLQKPGAAIRNAERIDYGAVYNAKKQLLRDAFDGLGRASQPIKDDLNKFALENAWWLDDYALYRAVKAEQDQKPWFEWPDALRLRDRDAIGAARERLGVAIAAEKFSQFIFFRQWSALKTHASRSNVEIIGDLPLFVALDSADVWCNQDKFKLGPDGTPEVVSGVPPDYFSETGQLWGNPIYDWDAMSKDGFEWWAARVHFALKMVDIIRIDHFRGLAAGWEVPGQDTTAENGKWVDVPGKALFTTLRESLGNLPMIAEDLGHITPDVNELRDEFEIPGMRILQFAFGGDAKNRDLPHNYVRNCVAYTGTHDNDTTLGWWQTLDERTRDHVTEYLDTEGDEINWAMIRAVWSSVADLAIAPMQDVLGIDGEGRMNLPATTTGNWQWRMAKDAFTTEHIQRLRELTRIYGRAPDKLVS